MVIRQMDYTEQTEKDKANWQQVSIELGTNREATERYLKDGCYRNCTIDDGVIILVDKSKRKLIEVFNVNQLDRLVDAIHANPGCFIKVNLIDGDKFEARRRECGHDYLIGKTEEVKTLVGIQLDVDAGKSDAYLSRREALETLCKMPRMPSMIIGTDGRVGGYHAYYLLEKPHRIIDNVDREKWRMTAVRWQAQLNKLFKGKLDSTANIDRMLRPVGSLRASGNRVELYYTTGNRYTEQDFYIPPSDDELREKAKVSVRKTFETILGPVEQSDKPIQAYIDAAGITPQSLMSEINYQQLRNPDEWMRPESSTKSRSVKIGTELERPGINVFSGGDPRFSCLQKNGDVGKFYSVDHMFVIIRFGGDWKAAAKWCHEQIDKKLAKVNLEGILS